MNISEDGKKAPRHVFLSILFGVVFTGISLLNVHFYMAPFSEEAGMIGRGFPHSIINSGPFYAGYGGLAATEGGKAYYLNAPGAFSNPYLSAAGLLANIFLYTFIGFFLVVIGSNRRKITLRIKDIYSKHGNIKSSLILILLGFALLLIIFFGFYFIMMIHTAFRMVASPY